MTGTSNLLPTAIYKPLPWQVAPWQDKAPTLLLTGSAGGGKALALDTEVPTSSGIRTMGDLAVGDVLFGIDGKQTAVVAVSDIMQGRPCYRVTFSSGESVIADANHQWRVSTVASRASQHNNPDPPPVSFRLRGSPQNRAQDIVISTAEMKARVERAGRVEFSLPTCGKLAYDGRPVPVPPYVLGYLLGDGYLPDASFTTADAETVAYIEQDLGAEYRLHAIGKYTHYICSAAGVRHGAPTRARRGRLYKHAQANRYVAMMRRPGGQHRAGETYLGIFKTEREAQEAIDSYQGETHSAAEIAGSGLRHALAEMGLGASRSADKFIPDCYKYNSGEVRLSVLRGLFDSDGYIDEKRGRSEFTSISERLARDVHELLCGFGVKPTIQQKRAKLNGKDCGPCWRVMFTDNLPVFRLRRKAIRVKQELRATQRRRYIVSVESVSSVPVRCIQVAAEDGIFLITRSAIPTHNSRLAAEKVHGFMLKYAGATGLVLRKAREYAGKSIVPFLRQTVIGDTPGVVYKKQDNTFVYDNGSMLYVGGMRDESQREGVRSIGPAGGLDIVWMEEASQFVEQDYNEILARMRGTTAGWTQIILTTNPGAPSHWIKKRMIDGGEAHVYYSRAPDNPHNPPAYIETLNKLTGVLRLRLRDGKWAQVEGAVYPLFDPTIHVLDPFPIPNGWRRFRAIDFGYTNPFVCQWWALDEDDRMYLYREIYMTHRTVRLHAKQINALSGNEQYEYTVADHDAEDRATLVESGIHTLPAQKEIGVGIQQVIERLRVQGDGRPRLFILRGALVELDDALEMAKRPTHTLEEFDSYAWPQGRDGAPMKELPVKENDHGMDALRYACMSMLRLPLTTGLAPVSLADYTGI